MLIVIIELVGRWFWLVWLFGVLTGSSQTKSFLSKRTGFKRRCVWRYRQLSRLLNCWRCSTVARETVLKEQIAALIAIVGLWKLTLVAKNPHDFILRLMAQLECIKYWSECRENSSRAVATICGKPARNRRGRKSGLKTKLKNYFPWYHSYSVPLQFLRWICEVTTEASHNKHTCFNCNYWNCRFKQTSTKTVQSFASMVRRVVVWFEKDISEEV